MKLLKGLYSVYLLIAFTFWFIFMFPFLLVPIMFKNKYRWTGIVNKIWAILVFRSLFLRVKIIYEEELDKDQCYVFCPNHFSYLDIPIVGMVKNASVVFVGKSALEKIPLFGWMYKKLHITVNRSSLKSKYQTLISCKNAIDEGKSLVIFPEGGILAKNPPEMARFKEGPFRVAIEKKVPLVPVTIHNNWKILGEDLLMGFYPIKIKFHKPIVTENLNSDDLSQLKDTVYKIVQTELNTSINHN